MADQHVRCWRVSGPVADIAIATRLTRSRHRVRTELVVLAKRQVR